MADNTVLNLGSGGDTIRDVQKSGIKTPVCIIDVGAGTAESLLSAGQALMAASLPVAIASNQSAVPVSLASLPALAAGSAVIGHVVVDTAPTTPVTGTFWQATQPVSGTVTVSNSGFAVVGNVEVTNDAGNPLPVSGTVTANAGSGTQAVSAASLPLPTGAATEATLSTLNGKVTAINTGAVVISAALPAGTNTIGLVTLAPATTGGLSVSRIVSAASTNATSAKASAGQLYGYAAFNNNAAWRYLKLYNKASAPAPASDTPFIVIGLPPGGGANLGFDGGIAFATGIAYAVTAGIADNDNSAVGAGDCAVNIFYK